MDNIDIATAIELLGTRVSILEKDSERNSNQHKEFYNSLKEIAVSTAVTQQTYGQILATLGELKISVSEIKAVPTKRWETVIACIITAVVSGAVALLIK